MLIPPISGDIGDGVFPCFSEVTTLSPETKKYETSRRFQKRQLAHICRQESPVAKPSFWLSPCDGVYHALSTTGQMPGQRSRDSCTYSVYWWHLMTRVCLSRGPTKWIQMFLATCLGFARREKQAIHPRDILQYLAISCNPCRMAPSQPSLKRKQESGAVLDYVSLPLSLSLSIIIILKILIVIRFKSTKSKKTAVLDQRPLMVSQTVSASTQVALSEIGVSNALALPWVGRQRQTKLQYGTCSSHLIVKLSMPYAFACWSSYPMSK